MKRVIVFPSLTSPSSYLVFFLGCGVVPSHVFVEKDTPDGHNSFILHARLTHHPNCGSGEVWKEQHRRRRLQADVGVQDLLPGYDVLVEEVHLGQEPPAGV